MTRSVGESAVGRLVIITATGEKKKAFEKQRRLTSTRNLKIVVLFALVSPRESEPCGEHIATKKKANDNALLC